MNVKAQKGINLIWEKKGVLKPEEVMVLTANYDTILKDPKNNKKSLIGEMPGADANASGVGSLLSMIEILNKLDLPKTVRVVFFDLENFEGQGSKHYRETFSSGDKEKVVGVIHVAMIGHDSRLEDKEKKLNNMQLYFSEEGEEFAKRFKEEGKRNILNLEWQLLGQKEIPTPFFMPKITQDPKIPEVLITQNLTGDLNSRYLTPNDFVETLNIATYTNVFKFLTSAVLVWNYDVVK